MGRSREAWQDGELALPLYAFLSPCYLASSVRIGILTCDFAGTRSKTGDQLMEWPPSSQTLMWLQIATGFFAAMTLMHWLRLLARRFGRILNLAFYFSPKCGCQEAFL